MAIALPAMAESEQDITPDTARLVQLLMLSAKQVEPGALEQIEKEAYNVGDRISKREDVSTTSALSSPKVLAAIEEIAISSHRHTESSAGAQAGKALIWLLDRVIWSGSPSTDDVKGLISTEVAILRAQLTEAKFLRSMGASKDKAGFDSSISVVGGKAVKKPPNVTMQRSNLLNLLVSFQQDAFDKIWNATSKAGFKSEAERKQFLLSAGLTADEVEDFYKAIPMPPK